MNSPEAKPARTPALARPRRVERLETLPLFFPLKSRRAVVIGGNEAAAWKAELLSAAGASVDVWADDICPEMTALAADPPLGTLTIRQAAWSPACFKGASIVVAAAADDAEARRIFVAARRAGVPVNVIDKPAFCTFQFGSIVNRSPLVIGISTGGGAPVFGQAIRSRIEALLPAGFARWAAAARQWREQVSKLGLAFASRRRFWERFTDLALRSPDRAPSGTDRDALIDVAACEAHGTAPCGHVTLVGAGPGNPELLTLKALRALRTADVILFDDLVAPEVLDFARREAKRMLVGKTGYGPSCEQAEINALMIGLAKTGKRVVRLKAGDPLIFGRAGEEIAALAHAGIPVDVVPGITAAQGAAASLKTSLTRREGARRVQFITGHARGGRLPEDIDLASLADRQTTTAVYMPLGTLEQLVSRLRGIGADPRRPVTAVFNATREDEVIVSGTFESISAQLGDKRGTGPCLLLIGAVSREAEAVAVSRPSATA